MIKIFEGSRESFSNLKESMSDKDIVIFPVEAKLKVYLVNEDELSDIQKNKNLSDTEFMDIAEQQGYVHTLKGYAKAFNKVEYRKPSFKIRFITNTDFI